MNIYNKLYQSIVKAVYKSPAAKENPTRHSLQIIGVSLVTGSICNVIHCIVAAFTYSEQHSPKRSHCKIKPSVRCQVYTLSIRP